MKMTPEIECFILGQIVDLENEADKLSDRYYQIEGKLQRARHEFEQLNSQYEQIVSRQKEVHKQLEILKKGQ